MNRQEIFATVVTHLRNQGARATNERGECQYRAPNGLKCAVGCLISDEDYKPSMEGNSVIGIEYSLPVELRPHIEVLRDLQRTHDETDVDYWEEDFKNLSKKWNVHIPKR